MNSGKSIFQEFVEANQGLLNCYNAVTAEEYKKLTDNQRDSMCQSHRQKIRDMLTSNQLVMSNLVRERVEILKRLGA